MAGDRDFSTYILQDHRSWLECFGKSLRLYNTLKQLSLLTMQQRVMFQVGTPVDALEFVTRADEIYCKIRCERSISEPSISISTKQTLADQLHHHTLYQLAFGATLDAHFRWKDAPCPMVRIKTWSEESLDTYFVDFLEWTQKYKACRLTDVLGIDARLSAVMVTEAETSGKTSALDRESQLVCRIKSDSFEETINLQHELCDLQQVMRIDLDIIMHTCSGSSMTLADIRELGTELKHELGCDIVFMDWVQVTWHFKMDLLMVLYCNGLFQQEIFLELKPVWSGILSMKKIQWIDSLRCMA